MKSWVKKRSVEYIVMVMVCLWLSDASATCGLNPLPSAVSFAFSRSNPVQVNSNQPYQFNTRLTEFNVSSEQWQFSHQYQILDYDGDNTSTPVTNGHLHTTALAYGDWNNSESLSWSVVPTLAISSNQARHSGSLNGSAFRVDGHLIWQKPLHNNSRYYMGGCASALTGDYGLIPVLAIQYQNDNAGLLLGYPYSQFDMQLMSRLRFVASWSLAGQQWQVLDKFLQNRSDLHLASEQVKLGIQMKLTKNNLLEAYWLDHINRAMEYLDQNGNMVEVDMDNSYGWMISYTYLM